MASRRRQHWSTLLGLLAATLGGCGRGTLGKPGSAGDGGIGGSDGGQIVNELPSCLRDLMAACPHLPPCHFNLTGGGVPALACYGGGVVASFSRFGGCATPEDTNRSTVIDVLKADGSPCYAWEMTTACSSTAPAPDATHTWRNASGAVVATGRDLPSFRVTCTVTGETCIAPLSSDGSEACARPELLNPDGQSCMGDGTCSLPLPAR